MDPILLDNIPLQLDQDALIASLRIKNRGTYLNDFKQLFETALTIGRPKAYYRMAYVEAKEEDQVVIDGVHFTSRILRMNLEPVHHVFAYVATCGMELETWAAGIDNLLLRFWADALSEAALRVASEALLAHLAERYQATRTASMNPGSLADWPLAQQIPLFNLLGDVRGATGVYLTDSLLMLPRKSVSGIEYPTESGFASCQLCPRDRCPGRRAAYDEALVAHYDPAADGTPLVG